MNFYEKAHQQTGHLHYEGLTVSGSNIIIDAAELYPGIFEVMAFHPSGRELASSTAYSLHEAEQIFNKLLTRYTVQPVAPKITPLSGKYAKLRDDLVTALKAGRAAEEANPEDGGTCNFDSAAISLPRWRSALVERAAQEAGTRCFGWDLFGGRRYVFIPNTSAQGNARSRNAEAMVEALKSMGYDAMDYCQMD